MTPASATAAAVAIAVALGLAVAIGAWHNRRSGLLRDTTDRPADDTPDLGLSTTGPTIVHFTAVWCGPCAAVRKVVDQVCEQLPGVAHVEIDVDANPVAGQQLSVLSLPTTLIFDADGRQRYRASGVPRPADLHAALTPLLT